MAPGPYSLAVMETVAKLCYGIYIMFKLCYINQAVLPLPLIFANQSKS